MTEPELRLIGGRCRRTQKIVFPRPSSGDYEALPLPTAGVLWSFTVQRVAPKSPPYRGALPFTPFAVGYVELPGALIVESRLTDIDFDTLRIGMPLQLTTVDLGAPGGERLLAFAFRPATVAASVA